MWVKRSSSLFKVAFKLSFSLHTWVWEGSIRYRQFFFGGVLGRKWKIGQKIFRAPPARTKGGSQIFRLRRAFFVVEALKTAKKPLKTAKNRKIFLKTSIFWKKWPQNFFACGGLFFRKIGRTILQIWSDKRGGVKNILYPPLDNVWLDLSG